jgi:Ca2+-binding RTX toxin-like protein
LETRIQPAALTWNPGTGIAVYTAGAAEVNQVIISQAIDIIGNVTVSFSDAPGITINCALPIRGGNAPGAPAYIDATLSQVEVALGDLGDDLSMEAPIFMIAWGQSGDDFIVGGNAGNLLYGDSGYDRLFGGELHDSINGGELGDTLFGGGGGDDLFGGNGTDELYGNDGDDWLYGGDHPDYLDGGADNDHLIGGSDGFADQLWGRSGSDVFYYVEDVFNDLNPAEGDSVVL